MIILLTRIILAIIGALLLADAAYLSSLGLFNFGVVIPFIIGLASLIASLKWSKLATMIQANRAFKRFLVWLGIGLSVWLVSVIYFFSVIARLPSFSEMKGEENTIIILGSGTPNCQASPALQARLDAGFEAAQKWPAAKIIVSGGQDWGRECTEGQIMGDYLRAKGLANERIVQEEASTSTEENLVFSKVIMTKNGLQEPVAIVTSDFHTMRAKRIAQRLNYTNPLMIPAPTPLYIRYNAWMREYFAFISGWLLREY